MIVLRGPNNGWFILEGEKGNLLEAMSCQQMACLGSDFSRFTIIYGVEYQRREASKNLGVIVMDY